MNDLQNLNLIELLPTSIASDETIRNICNAIAEKLQTINEKAELVLLLPRLDQLPETLVDELAWQYVQLFLNQQKFMRIGNMVGNHIIFR